MSINFREFWQRYEAGDRNFPGVNLAGETFEYEEFDNINLSNASLEGANISNFIFRNSNLSGVNLQGASFSESSFVDCNLLGANFAFVTAVDLIFNKCDLSNATITNTQFGDVYFVATNLTSSKWSRSLWCGGVSLSNLTQATLDNIDTSNVELIDSILPNGSLADHFWSDDLAIDKASPASVNSLPANQPTNSELSSDVGIDYTKLHDLLAAKKWTQADRETAKLMCKVVHRTFPDMIEVEEMLYFPCQDLQIIDQLWMQYSWNRFGLSIQNRLWLSITEEHLFDRKVRKQFFALTNWRENDSFFTIDNYRSSESIRQLPEAFMPAIGIWPYLYGVFFFGEQDFLCVYQRISQCEEGYC